MRKDIAKLICERPRYGGYQGRNVRGGEESERSAYARSRSKRYEIEYVDDRELDVMELENSRIENEGDILKEDIENLRLEQRRDAGGRNVLRPVADLDEQPKAARRSRTPMNRSLKSLNDFLAPVQRWLCKQVGRPWNKVFSELCQALPSGVMGDHVKGHIKGWVYLHVDVIDGMPVDRTWPFKASSQREISKNELYVHPVDGLLKWGKATSGLRGIGGNVPRRTTRQYKRTGNENVRDLKDGTQLHRRSGIWYHATSKGGGPELDSWHRTYRQGKGYPEVTWYDIARGWGSSDPCTAMNSTHFDYKALNKAELRKYKVSNTNV